MPQSKEQRDLRYKQRKELGLCIQCGKPTEDGKVHCIQHAREAITRNTTFKGRRQEEGRCTRCGGEPLPAYADKKSRLCLTCSLKRSAYANLGDTSRYLELYDLLEKQDYLCPYTGELLVVGDNATVDHKLPSSRFPDKEYDIDNVEWVSARINTMKGDLTKDEFLSFVRLIHMRLGG